MDIQNNGKKKFGISIKILIGLVSGVIVGLLLQGSPEIAKLYIKPIGTLFLNLVKMTIVPLVFSSLVVGVCGLGDVKKVGRIGAKAAMFFLITTMVAIIIGLGIGTLFDVGDTGFNIEVATVDNLDYSEPQNFIDNILNIVPTNPIMALANGDMLQIILFAIFIGGGIVVCGEKANNFKIIMNEFSEIMYKIIGGIMSLAPFAVFALIVDIVASNGAGILIPLIGLIFTVYFGCILHAIIVYSVSIKILAKMNPIVVFKTLMPAIVFAFSTASSSATLPFTLEATRKLGVSSSIRSFVVPLGATINMDGTAVFQGICVIFIANIYNIELTTAQLLTIILTATLASVGTAGVPGAGTVMLSMVLTSVRLPIEGVAVIMGVERILDMVRTALNITGDAVCSIVVAKSEKELSSEEAI